MFIPLRTDSPLRRTPYMNYALIALNVVMFLVQLFNRSVTPRYELNPFHLTLWAYFTYAFLHANWMHILGNMLFLYIFGNNVNDKMGHVGYLAFYLAGGVFAGVAYVASGSLAPVLGASGAIAAVTGAYLVLFPRSEVTVLFWWFYPGQIEIPSLWFIGFFFVDDLILDFAKDSGVAHTAHIGGTLFGVAVCSVLLMLQLLPRDQFDIVAMVQRWNRRRQYRDLVSKGYNPFGWTPASARVPAKLAEPPDPMKEQIIAIRAQALDAASRHDLPSAAQLYLQLRALDSNQVLSRQAQLDVGNQLASQQMYTQAAEAYEGFLRTYPSFDQIEQIELMLGIIYARYLNQYDQAKVHLLLALARLHGERQVQMAKDELARIEPLLTPNPGVG
jgi:membrane associated rhomboid family serine protease